ncbi:MAG: hypothetical protein R3272_11325 [Candidatus Promineifilaceae bacterium]|nr:hypothetical protein [Candidatus Promineifilaceae bacterium]
MAEQADLVTTAIIAAVAAAVDEAEKELFPDDEEQRLIAVYGNLKEALEEKYSGESELLEAVYRLEDEDTSLHRQSLYREVQIVEADEDPDLVEAADAVLQVLSASPAGEEHVARARQITSD